MQSGWCTLNSKVSSSLELVNPRKISKKKPTSASRGAVSTKRKWTLRCCHESHCWCGQSRNFFQKFAETLLRPFLIFNRLPFETHPQCWNSLPLHLPMPRMQQQGFQLVLHHHPPTRAKWYRKQFSHISWVNEIQTEAKQAVTNYELRETSNCSMGCPWQGRRVMHQTDHRLFSKFPKAKALQENHRFKSTLQNGIVEHHTLFWFLADFVEGLWMKMTGRGTLLYCVVFHALNFQWEDWKSRESKGRHCPPRWSPGHRRAQSASQQKVVPLNALADPAQLDGGHKL